jgi:hypothetical protein
MMKKKQLDWSSDAEQNPRPQNSNHMMKKTIGLEQ